MYRINCAFTINVEWKDEEKILKETSADKQKGATVLKLLINIGYRTSKNSGRKSKKTDKRPAKQHNWTFITDIVR